MTVDLWLATFYFIPLILNIAAIITVLQNREFSRLTRIHSYGDVCVLITLSVIPVINILNIIALICQMTKDSNFFHKKIHKELR